MQNPQTEKTRILTQQQAKILESSISPYKISKDLRSLIERINGQETIQLEIVPSSYTLRGKDNFKDITALHVILMMLCKVDCLSIDLNHSKLSKKLSVQESNSLVANRGLQVDQKFMTFLNENFADKISKNRIGKNSNKHRIQSLTIHFDDQPESIFEEYSINFAKKLLENLSKVSTIDQISQLKIRQHPPARKDFEIIENRQELLINFSSSIVELVHSQKVQQLDIGLEYQNQILKEISCGPDLEHLYLVIIREDLSISQHCLFQCLKRTTNLCNLRLNVAEIGESGGQFSKQLLEDILPTYNEMIQGIVLCKQVFPDLDEEKFADILWKCPFLGEIITAKTIIPMKNQKKIDRIMSKLRMRRVALQNYIDLLKVIDFSQEFSYENCLQILDCCEPFTF